MRTYKDHPLTILSHGRWSQPNRSEIRKHHVFLQKDVNNIFQQRGVWEGCPGGGKSGTSAQKVTRNFLSRKKAIGQGKVGEDITILLFPPLRQPSDPRATQRDKLFGTCLATIDRPTPTKLQETSDTTDVFSKVEHRSMCQRNWSAELTHGGRHYPQRRNLLLAPPNLRSHWNLNKHLQRQMKNVRSVTTHNTLSVLINCKCHRRWVVGISRRNFFICVHHSGSPRWRSTVLNPVASSGWAAAMGSWSC